MLKSITLFFSCLALTMVSAQEIGDTQTGKLNYYNDIYHGRPTASGDIYDKTKVSAAHKTLPMKTMVEVENLENGKSIFVEINDRIPEGSDAILELSRAAAEQLDFIHDGITNGKIRIIQVMNVPVKKESKHKVAEAKPKFTKAPVQQKEMAKIKAEAEIKKAEMEAEATKKRMVADNKAKMEAKMQAEKKAKAQMSKNMTLDAGPVVEPAQDISLEDAIKIGNKKFAIQLGAYQEKKSLQEAVNIAKKNGMQLKVDLFILTETTEKGELYKLIYGYFGEDYAREKIEEVKTLFQDSFIKKF